MTLRFIPAALIGALTLSGCAHGIGARGDGINPPGVNRFASAEDGVEVGHRLVAAGEYELALRAFTRAAIERGGTDGEILSAMGTANLGLGRLGQAEELLRLAVEKEKEWPEIWNNLGVVLMERGKNTEAKQIFQRAYAMDDGQSDSIRDNLRLALSKTQNSGISPDQINEYKVVRRGSADYLIRKTP